eukprot:1770814-Pyramimonas_sp.AAC.1
MKELAFAECEDGAERSLSTGSILEYWGLATCKQELLARRLPWYQSWATFQDVHVQVQCALFGEMVFEGDNAWPCNATGLTGFATPWAKRA